MPRSVAEERSRHGHPIVADATYKCACSACGQEIRAVLDTFMEGQPPRYVVPVDGDGRCRDCQEYGVDRSRCPLCHGQPVADADAWLDGRPRLPGPCPRCGASRMACLVSCEGGARAWVHAGDLARDYSPAGEQQ